MYSGDTPQPVTWSTKVDLAHRVLRTALHKGPALRDEVYAQLMKQVNGNPRVESKVWEEGGRGCGGEIALVLGLYIIDMHRPP